MGVFGSTLDGERNKTISGLARYNKTLKEELTKFHQQIEFHEKKMYDLKVKSADITVKIEHFITEISEDNKQLINFNSFSKLLVE